MIRFIAVLCLFVAMGSIACKKKDMRTEGQRSKDSALAYAKEIYIWYKNIPSNLNPQNYKDPNGVMQAIRPYSTEPGFPNPVDRWSFGILKKEWDDFSSGVEADFGMRVFFRTASDLRVASVDKNGPAGLAGIQRSWRISSINGTAINDTSQSNLIINAVYYSNSTRFVFTLPDNSTRNITLNSRTFVNNPFLFDSVYTSGSKKIGYFVLNSFLGDTTQVRNNFDRIFNKFSTNGVNDVVIDLRYNGGGYVMLAQYLLDYLVPSSGNNQVMLTYQYNDKYAARFNSSLNFSKKGNLNLSRVFFIVSKQSASASEMTINSIKPFLDVKLVGPTKTNGKPVGFFPISSGRDWYVFPVSFRTVNKNGEANYFNGFATDYTAADGLDKNWGDVDESCLSRAIRYITTGSWARVAPADDAVLREQQRLIYTNSYLDLPAFKGMFVKEKQLR